ncbi:MAG: hypothetical protein ACAH17_00795 [Candidatus Paceibacterota bacterium]
MRNALGAAYLSKRNPLGWRNRYFVSVQGDNYQMLREMEAKGLVEESEARSDSDLICFHVTETGIQALGEKVVLR